MPKPLAGFKGPKHRFDTILRPLAWFIFHYGDFGLVGTEEQVLFSLLTQSAGKKFGDVWEIAETTDRQSPGLGSFAFKLSNRQTTTWRLSSMSLVVVNCPRLRDHQEVEGDPMKKSET